MQIRHTTYTCYFSNSIVHTTENHEWWLFSVFTSIYCSKSWPSSAHYTLHSKLGIKWYITPKQIVCIQSLTKMLPNPWVATFLSSFDHLSTQRAKHKELHMSFCLVSFGGTTIDEPSSLTTSNAPQSLRYHVWRLVDYINTLERDSKSPHMFLARCIWKI